MIDIRNPSERKKLIGAGVLGLVAVLLLWWTFFGLGGSNSGPHRPIVQPTPSAITRATTNSGQAQTAVNFEGTDLELLRPVPVDYSPVSAPEAKRNIFVYYEPPPKPAVVATEPSPSPTPPPPVLLASLSPANVYARTGEFTLEISGDKFTPQLKVLVDDSELPTRYKGPQQISATVPAAVIANPGGRQVKLRSPDGTLYSNTETLNVGAPPVPNFTYVGIIGTIRRIDTAILQDKASKEILNVQRGDLLGGRFRVTSISEKELVLVDTNLKIRHTLPFTIQSDRGNPQQRPVPIIEGEDDEEP